MKSIYLGLAGGLLIGLASAQAQTVEVSPFYGYRWGGSLETTTGDKVSLKDSQAYGLALDVGPKDSNLKYELLWSRQDTSVDLQGVGGFSDITVKVDEFMVGGVYEYRADRFRAYATGLLGASVFEPEGSDTLARFCLSLGGGVKYDSLKNLAVRADVRGYGTVVDNETGFFYSNGVTIVTFNGNSMWQGEISAGFTLAF